MVAILVVKSTSQKVDYMVIYWCTKENCIIVKYAISNSQLTLHTKVTNVQCIKEMRNVNNVKSLTY